MAEGLGWCSGFAGWVRDVPVRHTICGTEMLFWQGFTVGLSLCITQFRRKGVVIIDIFGYLIVPLIVVIVVNIVMKFILKDKEKKDKGFVLFYQRLSYRRRFIRALWGIPFMLLMYFFIYQLDVFTEIQLQIVALVFVLTVLFDAGYNYYRWKKEEQAA